MARPPLILYIAMKQKHCYLFALEAALMQVGELYEELPLHCTLMHRFWSGLSAEELATRVRPLFAHIQPVTLIAEKHLLLGPKQVPVSELKLTDDLRGLHAELYRLLHELHVDYTASEWVGEGYRAHISERPNARLELASKQQCEAVYLIEVKMPGHDHKRLVRAKFSFQG